MESIHSGSLSLTDRTAEVDKARTGTAFQLNALRTSPAQLIDVKLRRAIT